MHYAPVSGNMQHMNAITKKPRPKESPEAVNRRVAAFRARSAENNLVRLEILAHKDDKPAIEEFARGLAEKRSSNLCHKHGISNCQACVNVS